jgi:hypothetical protein
MTDKSSDIPEHVREARRRGGQKSSRKGVPNKRTQHMQERVKAVMAEHYGPENDNGRKPASGINAEDWDPVVALALVSEDRRTAPEIRERCLKEVAQYFHAKRKAVEITGEDGGPVAVTSEHALTDDQLLDILVEHGVIDEETSPGEGEGDG